ncbi:MAG TPA: HAD family hydrolase [Wenzhouxiangellaceae bacterium]|nr:HAD family hydrolase [Wenzhouxiangellaceae bacterium]
MSRKSAILDIDGTLIDSNDAHARAWVDAGDEFGFDVAFDQVRPLIGMGGDIVLHTLSGLRASDPEGGRFKQRAGEIFRDRYLPGLDPMPGARALLRRLETDGIRRVVATSASPDDVVALLKQAGVHDLVEKTTSAGDVDESKPAPDIVEEALKQAGCAPRQAVMLGDTPYDIDAASKAGVPIVALRCGGGWNDEDLRGADAIFDDPADVLDHYDQLPFAK